MEMENEGHSSDASQSESRSTLENEGKKKNKYELTRDMKEKLAELPEILEFISKLQVYIERQKRKLQKCKKKIKKSSKSKSTNGDTLKIKHVSTQTGEECVVEVKTEVKSIAEEITEAAEEALKNTGFVYEETSGMYYDYNSGYYYNAEYGLYYDGNTGTYLRYNQSTEKYEFHSQVSIPAIEKPAMIDKKESRRKRRNDKHENKRIKIEKIDLEEGECSDTSKSSEIKVESIESSDCDSSNEHDYAEQWPPCMRIIVEETNVASIKKGTLYIITCKGGTLGREGDSTIVIPDINISKLHMGFYFNMTTNKYFIIDLGSCNGTFLNGERLSNSKFESMQTDIPHGSKVQVGGTILLCHIHGGNQTCGHCEPGLIQTKEINNTVITNTDKSLAYKKQLKQLKKKFGIEHCDQGKVCPGAGYTDRAQVRRKTIGSQNPHEKTQKASLNESIDSGNKGFKLLSKMGWKEGQALGKDSQGILEPVSLVTNAGNSGLGNQTLENDQIIANIPVNSGGRNRESKDKSKIWMKAQERYSKIEESEENIFNDL